MFYTSKNDPNTRYQISVLLLSSKNFNIIQFTMIPNVSIYSVLLKYILPQQVKRTIIIYYNKNFFFIITNKKNNNCFQKSNQELKQLAYKTKVKTESLRHEKARLLRRMRSLGTSDRRIELTMQRLSTTGEVLKGSVETNKF